MSAGHHPALEDPLACSTYLCSRWIGCSSDPPDCPGCAPRCLPAVRWANRLLSVLGRSELEELLPALEEVPLRSRQVLESPGQPIANVYFPESGLVSVLAVSGRDRAVEIGMIGDEGMTGAAAVLGDDRSTNRTVVHCPGMALRLPVPFLERAMRDNAALRRRLLHFVHAFSTCASQTALAVTCARLDERLARWILMYQDRLGTSEVGVTHELLAMVLGVRRPAVTLAMHSLEGNRLIRSTRKLISVVDREGLLKRAKGSYGTAEAEYLRLLHCQTASSAAVAKARGDDEGIARAAQPARGS